MSWRQRRPAFSYKNLCNLRNPPKRLADKSADNFELSPGVGDGGEDLFDSAHLPICEPNFYAVGMAGRAGQKVPDKTAGQFSGALVLF